MIAENFNVEDSEQCLSKFLYEHDAVNIVKEKACFKSIYKATFIELFITNSPLSLQNTVPISCGLSDFHKMVATAMEMKY